MKRIGMTGPILAAALLSAAPASAHEGGPTPASFGAATRYAMPLVLSALYSSCGDAIAADGFVRSQRGALEAKFAAGAVDSWPGARELLLGMAARRSTEDDIAIAALPDDALRPFVDAVVLQALGREIKPKDCPKIERAMELLDPLPVANLAGLVEFIFEEMETRTRGPFGIETVEMPSDED